MAIGAMTTSGEAPEYDLRDRIGGAGESQASRTDSGEAHRAPQPAEPLLELEDLAVHFSVPRGVGERMLGRPAQSLRAVDGVSLFLRPGEVLGLVGESGCGKSTLARAALRLTEPVRGEVRFQGEDVLAAGPRRMRQLRQHMQIIFQDPYASLNPRWTVERIVGLPLRIQGRPRDEIRRRTLHILQEVGLSPEHLDRYPHQFSGGQRQRIGIARALIVRPKLIVADEPVSALDVSVQAQILNLLQELRERKGLTYLFITHDLGVVSYVSDRIAVMYLGKIVEVAPTDALFDRPLHPYTRALLSAIPKVGVRRRERILLEGSVPTPIDPPSGCRFYDRCYLAGKGERCRRVEPPLVDVGAGRTVACHVVHDEVAQRG